MYICAYTKLTHTHRHKETYTFTSGICICAELLEEGLGGNLGHFCKLCGAACAVFEYVSFEIVPLQFAWHFCSSFYTHRETQWGHINMMFLGIWFLKRRLKDATENTRTTHIGIQLRTARREEKHWPQWLIDNMAHKFLAPPPPPLLCCPMLLLLPLPMPRPIGCNITKCNGANVESKTKKYKYKYNYKFPV